MSNTTLKPRTPQQLVGTWRLVSEVSDGQSTSSETIPPVYVVISEHSHSVYVDQQIVAQDIPFTVDASVTPHRTTDFLPNGQQIHGIWRVDGDTLISCVAAPGQPAPEDFVSAPDSGHKLRTFRRVTP